MTSAEQPLKKRKLYEFQLEEPPPPPEEQPKPAANPLPDTTTVAPPGTPPPLSQEEIVAKRRNRDEIKSVYDTYKRFKYFMSQKEGRHHFPELEQSYLSLISASRGCSSVQRIVADLIPRYASNFPTALQSAAKAVIDMHDSSLAVIKQGMDYDDTSFETAKTCMYGLADICHVAASAAQVSSEIQGIVSAAFRDALSFFVSSVEIPEILNFIDSELLKIQDSSELFSELKEKFCHEDHSSLVKLFKLRALCLLWMFFSHPKKMVTACFELLKSSESEEIIEGQQFINLLTSQLNIGSETDSLLHLVLQKHDSMRSWMFLKYMKFFKKPPSMGDSSAIRPSLEYVFDSFPELKDLGDLQIDSDEDISDPSKLPNQQYSAHRKFNDQGYGHESGSVRAMDWETSEPGGSSHGRSSTHRDVMNQHVLSPVTRRPVDLRNNSFDGRSHNVSGDENSVSAVGFSSPSLRSAPGALSNTSNSPRHNLGAPYGGQSIWFCDGDPIAMEVFSASRELWIGFFSPDVSEAHLRFELDRFGPMEQFFFFQVQGFALAEYRSLIDAVRAREYMRIHFPWKIKFMDVGLGTRGTINGAAVGSSRYVYAGNISSQWARDELLHESRKVIYKGPYMVTDLYNEGAMLMEFESPEEATAVMAHLRQHRKDKFLPPSDASTSNAGMPHLDGTRLMPRSSDAETRTSNPGYVANESGQVHAIPESPADSSRTRLSHLSPLLSSLRAKHNMNQFDSSIYQAMGNMDQVPSSTLWIHIPNVGSPFLADDELMSVCSLAISNVGTIVRLQWAYTQMGNGWFVECSNVDAAITCLKNLRNNPGTFFQVEFSQQAAILGAQFPAKPENSPMELVSPRMNLENGGASVHLGHPFGSSNPSQGAEQMWMYKNNETELRHGAGSYPCAPVGTQGQDMPLPSQFQPAPFAQPVYQTPNSSWDPRVLNHHVPFNEEPSAVMNTSFQGSTLPPPFVASSSTPLAQGPGAPVQHFDQSYSLTVVPPLASVPSHRQVPPLPPSPPPAPPPPSSPPPPPPIADSADTESSVHSRQFEWQGALCKSGVHYCTIYALRVESEVCKYLNALSEPSEWPAKLDMTKRTDFRHVKSTFSGTPTHKREVCQLLPSSLSDQKGYQDFIAYLKQRECAGVIKIPTTKSIWGRLLFILPYSKEVCSMLCIPLDASPSGGGLIGLILPKETNLEWA
ncbi:hypothetical protein LINPERPRIM_LOCUS15391 [Linum perenne]